MLRTDPRIPADESQGFARAHLGQDPSPEGVFLANGICEGCEVIHVRGEIDVQTAPALEAAISKCREGWPVIVDLSSVRFMSAAGIHVLFGPEAAALVSVVCPPGHTARLLALVGAPESRIYPDIRSAVQDVMLVRCH